MSGSLTKRRRDLLIAARDRFGVKHVWTDRGNILVKSPNEPSVRKKDPLANAFEIVFVLFFVFFFFLLLFFCPFSDYLLAIFVISIIILKNCRFSVLHFLLLLFFFSYRDICLVSVFFAIFVIFIVILENC